MLFGDTGWHLPKGFDRTCTQTNCSLWYQGVELLPRDLGLDSGGKLTIRPIPEIANYRQPGSLRSVTNLTADNAALHATIVAKGSLLELQLNCSGRPVKGARDSVGMHVLATADHTSFTVVGFNFTNNRLFVDHRSSSPGANSTVVQTAPLDIKSAIAGTSATDAPTTIELVCLVDNALVESFANGEVAISSWVAEVMGDASPTADERVVFLVPPPKGVHCTFKSWSLEPLAAAVMKRVMKTDDLTIG